MIGAAQLPLVLELATRDAWPRCGRAWAVVVVAAGLRLDRLRKMPEADLWSTVTCYLGTCRGEASR